MYLNGEISSPDHARLLWEFTTDDPSNLTQVELILEGSETYIGSDSEWLRVQDPLGLAVPATDSFTLLDAIEKVKKLPSKDTAGGLVRRFSFELDSERYAELMRDRTQELVSQSLGKDVILQPDPGFWQQTGSGEVWIGADGLPHRMYLTLLLPEVTSDYDARLEMQLDYHDFGEAIVTLPEPILGAPDADHLLSEPRETTGAILNLSAGDGVTASFVLAAILILAIVLFSIRSGTKRRVRATVVMVTILSLVTAFPLQVGAAGLSRQRMSVGLTLPEALTQLGLMQTDQEPVGRTDVTQASASTDVTDCAVLPDGIAPDEDYDADGISNLTENCLGTSYRDADTDSDSISDSDELKGFTVGAQTWTTNPLMRDSNLDGMDDFAEWSPSWATSSPSTLDVDADGVANAWDDDNDGDGVIDDLDISPYAVLPYKSSFNLSASKPGNNQHKNTYVYVDLMVQPSDAAHLRYFTTPLDWPYDDKGQIRDYDNSDEDITLVPMLEFETPTRPSLTSQYGLIVVDPDTPGNPYRVLAPLAPTGAQGAIDAFKTRVAFTDGESVTGLEMNDIKVGWLGIVTSDSQTVTWVRKRKNTGSYKFVKQTSISSEDVVATAYYEPSFRIVGMNIVETQDIEVAVFGAPNAPETVADDSTPDEGREMYNFIAGLNVSYLYNLQPDLPTIVDRFTNAATAQVERWGVESDLAVKYNTFAHQDQALAATTMTDTVSLLDGNYATSRKPILALAYEGIIGTLSLEQEGSVAVNGNTVSIDLAGNSLAKLRQVQISQYEWSGGSWSALSMADALSDLDNRYPAQAGAASWRDFRYLYLSYYGALSNYIEKDGVTLVGQQADDQAVFDWLSQPSQNSLPGFVQTAYKLDSLNGLKATYGELEGWRTWQESFVTESIDGLDTFLVVVMQALSYTSPEVYAVTPYWGEGASAKKLERAIDASTGTIEKGSSLQQMADQAYRTSTIGVIMSVMSIWSQYNNGSKDTSNLQQDVERAEAIATSIALVLLLVLTIADFAFGGGLLGAILGFSTLDSVSNAIGVKINLQSVFSNLAKSISGAISNFSMYSQLASTNPVTSGALSMTLGDENKGIVLGNSLSLATDYRATIVKGPGKKKWNWRKSRDGKFDDVKSSSAYAEWKYDGSTGSVTADTPTYRPDGCTNDASNQERTCKSSVSITITPEEAVRDLGIRLTTVLNYSLRYQSCFGVNSVYSRCKAKTTSGAEPRESDTTAWNDATNTVYVDILPVTLGDLWDWQEIDNHDYDGDSLPDDQESGLGTSPTIWDSDGDRLSDNYEYLNRNNRLSGSDPLDYDSDDDGLSDRQELLLGTSAGVPDTDGDGLKDGEEACYRSLDGSRAGGWIVSALGSGDGFEYYVCSNPLEADYDNDSMTDIQEKTAGTSPFAPNTAPRLSLTISQPVFNFGVSTLVVLGPGELLDQEFSLNNVLSQPLTTTLSLCALSGAFDSVTVIAESSNSGYTLPAATSGSVGNEDCTYWDLSQSPLYSGEEVSVQLQASTATDISSGTIQQSLSLPYIDPTDHSAQQVKISKNIVVDVDEPQSVFVMPVEGEVISGISYVIGGTAYDATTWVQSVEVAVDGGAWQTAAGADTWSWTWTLPTDGIYTLSARASDIAGNVESVATTRSVTIDNTAPAASFTNIADGDILSGITLNSQGGATISLQGNATDLLSEVADVAGLQVIQLSVDAGPWEAIWNPRRDPVDTSPWTHNWLVNAGASGSHTLSVRAIDAVGQIGDAEIIDVILDLLPPLSSVSNYTSQLQGNTTSTLRGYIDDTGNVPLPPRPQLLEGAIDSLSDATIWIQADRVGDLQDANAAWIGDFNADGLADAAVGLPKDNSGDGQIVIIYGAAGDWPVPPQSYALSSSPSSVIASGGSNLGEILALAGDVNGDGLSDLLVGDPLNDQAYLLYGRTDTIGEGWDLSLLAQSGQSAFGVTMSSMEGKSGLGVASAGDVNNDGYADLLIADANKLYLVMGRSRYTPQMVDIRTQAAAVLPFDSLGGAVATGIGDVDGDGLADFVTSDPAGSYGAQSRVYLFRGSTSYRTASFSFPQQSLDPLNDAIASFVGDSMVGAQILALGDVNLDSYADFLYSSGDAPRLVFGRADAGWGHNNGGDRTLSYSPPASGVLTAPGDINADGFADLLLGTASGDAYLIYGADSLAAIPPIAATIEGIESAASAPYATGADINGDLSADLLVLPTGVGSGITTASQTPFGRMPHLGASALPVGAAPRHRSDPSLLLAEVGAKVSTTYVDDDYCSLCENDGRSWGVDAFDDIATAVTNTLAKGQVVIMPGLYQAFEITNSDLTIQGVDPDAVIVDGGGGDYVVQINQANAISLENLTLRNATKGISLVDARTGDWFQDRSRKNELQGSVAYDVTYPIYTDRSSALEVIDSTLVGTTAADEIIFVDTTTPDPSLTPAWSTLANMSGSDQALGGLAATDDYIYQLGDSLYMYRYHTFSDSWSQREKSPFDKSLTYDFNLSEGGGGAIYVYAVSSGKYATYTFSLFNDHTNKWTTLSNFPDYKSQDTYGPEMVFDGEGTIYALVLQNQFYEYDIATDVWTQIGTTPDRFELGNGAAITYADGAVYVSTGEGDIAYNEFYKYNVQRGKWSFLPNPPTPMRYGADIQWDGLDTIYAVAGGDSKTMLSYSIARKKWTQLSNTLKPIGPDAGLTRQDTALYVHSGSSTNGNRFFWDYSPVGINAVKLDLDSVALVAPVGTSSPQWLNLNDNLYDYYYQTTDSMWVGGDSWSPTPDSTPIAFADAQFRDPSDGVYRVGAGTALSAGYHSYLARSYVSTDYCSACENDDFTWRVDAFDSIQEAIYSGAELIQVRPGIYRENFSLVSGVDVVGAGGETTIIQPPSSAYQGALVSAEGTNGIRLAHLSLDGSDTAVGFRIEDGAGHASLERAIVRNAVTGVSVNGAESQIEMVNNTVVNNEDGIVASDCGSIDIRNTIIAYQENAGLDLASCATTQLHTYNLYWRNGIDLVSDGSNIASSTSGELFDEPRFVDPSIHNYQLRADSAARAKGDPSDQTLPGSGARIDIGAWQYAQAAFYVDDDFCESCENSGLDWQVNAFDTIQTSIDAASTTMAAALGSGAPVTYTIGVAAGAYNENISLPSYTYLLGVGADEVTLIGAGSGSVVSIGGATRVMVSGMTITGSGTLDGDAGVVALNASSYVTITRNILTGNADGIRVDSGASGTVIFNTIVDNSAAGVSTEGTGTWSTVRDNILAGNDAGLSSLNGGTLFNDYNLFYDNTANFSQNPYAFLGQRPNDILNQDPLFVNPGQGDYHLQLGSPALDVADELAPVPIGGGSRADMGYSELVAVPLTLLLGELGISAAQGNSGVASAQIGISHVISEGVAIDESIPSSWSDATLTTVGETGSYWNADVNPGPEDGLYRIYTRGTDVAGNQESGRYNGTFIADSALPVVNLLSPAGDDPGGAAAYPLEAEVSDYVSTGSAEIFNISSIYFEVNGEVIRGEWASDGWAEISGLPRRFQAVTELDIGDYTIIAYAVDRAGNIGQSSSSTITSSPSEDVLTISRPAQGQAINSDIVTVSGYVRFAAPSTESNVTISVNGQAAGTALLAEPGATLTAWSAELILPGDGSHTIKAEAFSDPTTGEPATGSEEISVLIDQVVPILSIDTPDEGSTVYQSFTLSGTASDGAGSGIESLETSRDGGFSWTKQIIGPSGNWSVDWEVSIPEDYVSHPILVRVSDAAGNEMTRSRQIIIDNLGPVGYTPVSTNPAIGSYIDTLTPVNISWWMPQDGSGDTTMYFATNTLSDTIPTSKILATGYQGPFTTAGTWYFHLMVEDSIGNQDQKSYGPFYVEDAQQSTLSLSAASPDWTQSIIIDGKLDIDNGEWRIDTEQLDTDPRSQDPHALFAAWDSSNLYLGWQEAHIGLHDSLWFYLDTKLGGTIQAVHAGNLILPMQADYAIEISSSTEGMMYRFDGDSWVEMGAGSFDHAHDAGADTEISVPLATIEVQQSLGLLAFSFDDRNARITTVFPTANPLATCDDSGFCPDWSDVYRWQNLGRDVVPNEGQPRGHYAEISLSSPQGHQTGRGPGDILEYIVTVRHLDDKPIENLILHLDGSIGLLFESLQYESDVTAQGDRWWVNLENLEPFETRVMTLTASLASDLTAIDYVTVTAELDLPVPLSEPVIARSSYVHRVDGQPPTTYIDLPVAALPSGSQIVRGTATDRDGGGVQSVEVRVDDGSWLAAEGSVAWSAAIEVPLSGAFELAARSRDTHGHVGPAASLQVLVDAQAPEASLALNRPVLAGRIGHLEGTAIDFGGSGVASVQVQVDGGAWIPVSMPLIPGGEGVVQWHYNWIFANRDGVESTLSVRASDAAGNVGPASSPQVVIADSVKPTSTILQPQPGSEVDPDGFTISGMADDGYGVRSVEVSIDGGRTWSSAQLGASQNQIAWSLDIAMHDDVPEQLVILSRAIDKAGNQETLGAPTRVTVTQIGIPTWLPLVVR
ncbi:MAG: hypothetical protein GY764_15875 [Halieaceae bacterium]|nr:hypothetical protein [Halieaceae bacterium]